MFNYFLFQTKIANLVPMDLTLYAWNSKPRLKISTPAKITTKEGLSIKILSEVTIYCVQVGWVPVYSKQLSNYFFSCLLEENKLAPKMKSTQTIIRRLLQIIFDYKHFKTNSFQKSFNPSVFNHLNQPYNYNK